MGLQEDKEAARRTLHERLSRTANYYEAGPAGPAFAVTVRLLRETTGAGELPNASGYAQTREDSPRLIFLRDEREPRRGHVVVFSTNEAYRVETTDQPDGATTTAHCVRLSASEAASFTPPGA